MKRVHQRKRLRLEEASNLRENIIKGWIIGKEQHAPSKGDASQWSKSKDLTLVICLQGFTSEDETFKSKATC